MRWRGSATTSNRPLGRNSCGKYEALRIPAVQARSRVGGHCIPIDPNYLSHRVQSRLGYPFRFVELAQEINAAMPRYIARRIQDQLNLDGKALRGSLIILLGVTYKPTSRIPASLRNSTALKTWFSRVLCCGSTIHWSSSSRFRLGHLTCG